MMCELLEVYLDGRRDRVQPVSAAQEQFHRLVRLHVLRAEGDDRNPVADRAFHLALDVPRLIGVGGKDEHTRAARRQRIDDLCGILLPRPHVSRRNPATDPVLLQVVAHRVGDGLVHARIADKDVVSHDSACLVRHGPRKATDLIV
jgi:hypothetical protein